MASCDGGLGVREGMVVLVKWVSCRCCVVRNCVVMGAAGRSLLRHSRADGRTCCGQPFTTAGESGLFCPMHVSEGFLPEFESAWKFSLYGLHQLTDIPMSRLSLPHNARCAAKLFSVPCQLFTLLFLCFAVKEPGSSDNNALMTCLLCFRLWHTSRSLISFPLISPLQMLASFVYTQVTDVFNYTFRPTVEYEVDCRHPIVSWHVI